MLTLFIIFKKNYIKCVKSKIKMLKIGINTGRYSPNRLDIGHLILAKFGNNSGHFVF